MARRARLGLLCGLLGAAVLAAALAPSIPQDPAYHRMADGRVVLGIPNGLNVVSNVPFVLVGALWGLFSGRPADDVHFKHLAAALSGYWVWRMLMKRQPA